MLYRRSILHFAKVVICLAILSAFFMQALYAQQAKTKSHNPVIEGWYADPEGVIFENKYWIFPTYSAKYKQQVFLDAFSSTDMVTWKKHPKIIDTSIIKWAYMAMWAPSIVKKDNKYFFHYGYRFIPAKMAWMKIKPCYRAG